MAEVESISHSGIEGPDSRAIELFYEEVLGGARMETCSRSYEGNRGGDPHPCGVIGDYVFVIFPDRSGKPKFDDGRIRGGIDGDVRHAFSVSRERFGEIQQRLTERGVPFEGPVVHPERGPLGESIYFRDAGGNYFEVCWRRDAGIQYAPVPVSQG